MIKLGEIFVQLKLDYSQYASELKKQEQAALSSAQRIEKANASSNQKIAQSQVDSGSKQLSAYDKFIADKDRLTQRSAASMIATQDKAAAAIMSNNVRQDALLRKVSDDFAAHDARAQYNRVQTAQKSANQQLQAWQGSYDSQIKAEEKLNASILASKKSLNQQRLKEESTSSLGSVSNQSSVYEQSAKALEKYRYEVLKHTGQLNLSEKQIQIHNSALKSGLPSQEAWNKAIGNGSQQAGFFGHNIEALTKRILITSAALTLFYASMRAIESVFTGGLKAIEDYNIQIATMAGFITTFADKTQKGGNIAEIYKAARNEAKQLVNVLEILDSKTIASGKDLRIIAEGFIKQGVEIDIQNKETQQGLINIATAAKLLTAGQNQEIQLRQEIRALAQGQVRDSNLLVKAIEPMVPNIKQQIIQWKAAGELIPKLGKLFEGLGLASKDMEITWATIGSTLETTQNRILREGMLPIYKDLLGVAILLRDRYLDSNGALTEQARILQGNIASGWESLKNVASIVWSIISPFVPLLETVGRLTANIVDGWSQLAAVIEPIFKRMRDTGNIMMGVIKFNQGDIAGSFRSLYAYYKESGEKSGKAFSSSLSGEIDENLRKYYAARDNKMGALPGTENSGERIKSNVNLLSILKETNKELDKTTNRQKVINEKYQEIRDTVSATYNASLSKGLVSPEMEKEYRNTLANISKAESMELGKVAKRSENERKKIENEKIKQLNKESSLIGGELSNRMDEVQKYYDSESKLLEANNNAKIITEKDYIQNKRKLQEDQLGKEQDLMESSLKKYMDVLDKSLGSKAGLEEGGVFDKVFESANSLSAKLEQLGLDKTLAKQLSGIEDIGLQNNQIDKLKEKLKGLSIEIMPEIDETKPAQKLRKKLDEIVESFKELGVEVPPLVQKLYAELDTQSSNWLSGAVSGLREYARESQNVFESVGNMVQKAFKGMEDALVNFVKTGKISFTDMVDSMVTDLIRLMIQQSITGPLAGAASSFIGGLIGGGAGSSSLPAVSGASKPAMSALGNIFNQNGFQKFANGGAFTNSIVSKPTIFPFANGTGLMGEAGPEAIMPLKRTSSGKLGVISESGGGMSVIINNFGSEKVETKEVKNASGGKSLIVQIGEVVANDIKSGGPVSRAMKDTFGMNPRLATR